MKLTGLCWRSWAALRAYVGGLGLLLGPILAVLGRFGAFVGGLGPLLGLCLRSWAALGTYVGGLGALWAGLRAPCVRSWAALGAYVGGLGSLLGPLLVVLGRPWGLCSGKMQRTWLP